MQKDAGFKSERARDGIDHSACGNGGMQNESPFSRSQTATISAKVY